jgi:septal ring factor EnvC (AmiA/AmiB activator)
MPAYTLAQAIAATGRSRSTLIRAIRQGTITATRDEAGTYLVEPSELHRVFPAADHGMPDDLPNGVPRHAELAARFEAEQAKNAILLDQISDLRHRLDEERSERRQTADRLAAAQERIAALLTDQRTVPARRSWWPWRRV